MKSNEITTDDLTKNVNLLTTDHAVIYFWKDGARCRGDEGWTSLEISPRGGYTGEVAAFGNSQAQIRKAMSLLNMLETVFEKGKRAKAEEVKDALYMNR